MPSGGAETRARRKLRLKRHRYLNKLNERRNKVGMLRVDTFTKVYRDWKIMREKEKAA